MEDTTLAAVPSTSITTSAIIIPMGGFTGTVTLALSNQDGSPTDPGISLTPNSITVTASALSQQSVQRQVTIMVGPAVAHDTFELRIAATSGSLSSEADLTLTVADTLQPQVDITGPSDGDTFFGSRQVDIVGTLSAVSEIASLSIGGVASVIDTEFDQNSFTITVELADNLNDVIVTAEDGNGRLGSSSAVMVDFPFLNLEDFQRASAVIGQPDFVSGDPNQGGAAAANTISLNIGSPTVTDSGLLFIPDTLNNRILGFIQVPTINNASADFVLGQPDFTTTVSATSATSFASPFSVSSNGTELVLADRDNRRVLIWNTIPTTTQAPADVVVGQPDFVTKTASCDDSSLDFPESATIAGGKLIVADNFNNRVLIWNSVPTANGQAADLVLGQNSFTTCVANDDDQDGVNDGIPRARTLFQPTGLWSDGTRLVVADTNNGRVLFWNTFPTSNFTPADLVLGQPDFTTRIAGMDAMSFASPRQVFSNGNQVFVGDLSNHRVLIFDGFPTANGQAADRVLGQSNFTSNTANDDNQDGVPDAHPTARTLNFPSGSFTSDGRLLAIDGANNRLLIFESP